MSKSFRERHNVEGVLTVRPRPGDTGERRRAKGRGVESVEGRGNQFGQVFHVRTWMGRTRQKQRRGSGMVGVASRLNDRGSMTGSDRTVGHPQLQSKVLPAFLTYIHLPTQSIFSL